MYLEGSLSGRSYSADVLRGVDPVDQRPLLARYDVARARESLNPAHLTKRSGGVWRWHELLPVRQWRSMIHLGEGATPLHAAPDRVASLVGLKSLWIKRESLNPTGSFKARGMAVAVSRAAELGARHLVAPSAGNAGGALAAYAAAAGVRATVVMPADAPDANVVEVIATGAGLILLEGLISDCGRLARLIADETGAFDLSTLREPYRVEGKKTMGFELAEDYEWRLPDAIVYPTGGGTGIVGMWKAFDELEALGWIASRRPRMYCVQAEGCAPIVRAFAAGDRFAKPWEAATTAAAGLRVPSSLGDFLILDCLRESGGSAVAVPERDILQTRRRLGESGLGYASLETAAAAAGLRALVDANAIGLDDEVVLFDTGAGFKSTPAGFESPRAIPNDEDYWRARVLPGLRSAATVHNTPR